MSEASVYAQVTPSKVASKILIAYHHDLWVRVGKVREGKCLVQFNGNRVDILSFKTSMLNDEDIAFESE